ncbi:biotin--[acetyl-CoA-carboxylase] ligase [Methylobacterium sp. A54F]
MSYRLGGLARAEGHRLHVHESLPSTNTEAMEQARAGAAGPLWVVARRQEAGRGRRGNAWISQPGNLAASVLWPVPGVEPERIATLGFVAGVALAEAVEAVTRGIAPADIPDGPDRSLRLKWPNDLLAGGAKLAGILLEAEVLAGGRRAVVIGFGVNVAAAPEGLTYPAASLAGLGYAVQAEKVLEELTNRVTETARIWNRGRGFPNVRTAWVARASGLGAPVAVRTGTDRIEGIFDGIDEGGRLVILAPDGRRRTVTAGEVHFGTAATAA